jgi:hypothetical protein
MHLAELGAPSDAREGDAAIVTHFTDRHPRRHQEIAEGVARGTSLSGSGQLNQHPFSVLGNCSATASEDGA